jgi:mannose-6-phosphate isomerase-like protein (cupin superfamily)
VTDLNGNSVKEPGTDRTGVVRRVVTGIDERGRSYVISDGLSPNRYRSASIAGFGAAQLWYTKPGVVSNAGEGDNASAETAIPMHPEIGATIFRIADFPPDSAYTDSGKAALFSEIGGNEARAGADQSESKHFWFHKTDSIDYAIVLEGEISLLLDEHECLLRAGDVVVQRGTSHAWANRSDRVCRMAFVLIGAPPVPVAAESGLASQTS